MGRRSGAQRAKSQYYTSDLSLPARASAMPASAACLSCGRTLLTAVFALASLVVLSGDNALAQGSVAGDRLALVALYHATDGANWTNNTNWLTNEAISEWHGVVTDGEGRVKRLLLGHNELSGEIPAALGNLTNLQVLRLNYGTLSGSIPVELGDLTNLRHLELYNNWLSGEIPAALGNLANLQKLHLGSNELSGTIPVELRNLANLRDLYLGHNGLSGEIPVELGSLTNLEDLSLYGNELSGEIPAELGNLTNLERVNLGGNELSGSIPPELGDLANLKWLYLFGNELSGTIPVELRYLSELRNLSVSNANVCAPRDTIFRAWLATIDFQGVAFYGPAGGGGNAQEQGSSATDKAALEALYDATGGSNWTTSMTWKTEEPLSTWHGVTTDANGRVMQLLLSNNQLTGMIPSKLGDSTNLAWLDLSRNLLSGEIPPELGDLANLEVLRLSGNQLTGEIPVELGNLTNLRDLYLSGNELSGPIPVELRYLSELRTLSVSGTNVCAPRDTIFQAWLATIDFQGADFCGPTGGSGGTL